jgi:hypothetical protein
MTWRAFANTPFIEPQPGRACFEFHASQQKMSKSLQQQILQSADLDHDEQVTSISNTIFFFF